MVRETLASGRKADLLGLTGLLVHDNELISDRASGNGSLNLSLDSTLVEVGVAVVTVGGHQGTRRGQGQRNGVELHCDSRRVSKCGSVRTSQLL